MAAVGKGATSARKAGGKSWMVKMQSQRIQCCLCTCSVISALLGMFVLSAGVCLVLNYNFLDVDTSGLPSNLHNDEGKKVVGIILICLGIFAMIISLLVSILYFTACTSRQTPHSSVGPHANQQQPHSARNSDDVGKGGQGRPSSQESHGHHPHHHHHHHRHLHGNGMVTGRGSPSLNGASGSGAGPRRGGSLPNIRSASDPVNRSPVSLAKDVSSYSRSGMKGRNHTPPSTARPHRRGKKGRHPQGRYKNPLEPHPEEAGGDSQSLNESRRSASSSRRVQGYVNQGAVLDEDLEMARGSLASGGSSRSSVSHSVIIKVDSAHVSSETSPSHRPTHHEQFETEFNTDLGESNIDYGEHKSDRHPFVVEDLDDDDASGRMSRSTMDSLDLSEGTPEDSQAAKQRLDERMQELLS